MPGDYDERRRHFFYLRLTTAIEGMSGKRADHLSLDDLEKWVSTLLTECTRAYNGTCGEVIKGHTKGALRSLDAENYTFPCSKCNKRLHTIISHLRDRHGATLYFPKLPVISFPQTDTSHITFELEQILAEYPRITDPPAEDVIEDESTLRNRADRDIDELKELRLRQQRLRDPA
ncbi:unnamed protein product [Heligmosomoides polygyrus]|uniref:PAZ domain-containing protein n=1 Tax=Heligmosomoides polygyrus TaxID=6339 RepID=A0A183FXP3_HELPZ|nr:unnamed protein product [Heligmosomoides polygyrus]